MCELILLLLFKKYCHPSLPRKMPEIRLWKSLRAICCCSVAQSWLTLCNPMDFSMRGFPVLHYLLEFAQTHGHWVGDDIQPSHPLSSTSPPAFNLSQHQGLFKWVSFFASGGQNIGASASTSVLPMNIQIWFPLGLIGLISLQSKRLLRVFSSTTLQKHQFFGVQPNQNQTRPLMWEVLDHEDCALLPVTFIYHSWYAKRKKKSYLLLSPKFIEFQTKQKVGFRSSGERRQGRGSQGGLSA